MSVKNIVTNVSALKAKYGTNYPIVQSALTPLIAHDRAKGIVTTVYDVSDPVQMAKVNAPLVTDRTSAKQFKATFDAIVSNTNPHYSMILGAGDVVPFVPIVNPVIHDDPDQIVPSDLPYACKAAYSTSAYKFTSPSRILTRLPDVAGGSDANDLAAVLRTPITYHPVPPSKYLATYLSPGVYDWKDELEGALPAVFGNSSYLYLCPPNGPDWTSSQYQESFHYINCHGGDNDPTFSGQKGSSYPTAMDSSLVRGRLTNGMGCVAACCYSAQLYNPFVAGGVSPALPMSNTYLLSNAIFYLGSSVICYGGSPPYYIPTNANLAASTFANRILQGDAIGEAMLVTWQRLSTEYTYGQSPVVLKTLIEFMAFGDVTTEPIDPSLHVAKRSRESGLRAIEDAHRLAGFESIAQQLAQPIGAYDTIGASDVPDTLHSQIESIVARSGDQPIASSALLWTPSPEARARSETPGRPDRRCHLVTARTSEASIYDFDILYEIMEAGGHIVSVQRYPRR